jgi:hypothetical protein
MSRTYKDIRPEYRAERRRQITYVEQARVARTLAADRARDRREAARELTAVDLSMMQAACIAGGELWA